MSNQHPRPAALIFMEQLASGESISTPSSQRRLAELGARAKEIGRLHRGESSNLLLAGDWVRRPQSLISHHGIYISPEEVVHATVKRGVVSTSLATFADGQDVQVVRRCPQASRRGAVERARYLVQQKLDYNLFVRNCEQLASWVQTGHATSTQLDLAVFVALFAATGLGLLWAEGRC